MSSNGPDDYKPSRLEIPAKDGETIVSLEPVSTGGVIEVDNTESDNITLDIGSRMAVNAFAVAPSGSASVTLFTDVEDAPSGLLQAYPVDQQDIDSGGSESSVRFTEPWTVTKKIGLRVFGNEDGTEVQVYIEAAGV
jgi:hypothetical protein